MLSLAPFHLPFSAASTKSDTVIDLTPIIWSPRLSEQIQKKTTKEVCLVIQCNLDEKVFSLSHQAHNFSSGSPPIKIHEEELGHYISKSSRKKGRPALNQPLQSKQTGVGTPLLGLARTSDSYGTNPTKHQQLIELPLHPRISTFAVSDVPALDIHKVAQI
ncbi:hypothetical protein J6590_056357 [Homalodisca vitripennis]|nr:hypothetical protein J6590_056357 [Homalodisca vitripennis]